MTRLLALLIALISTNATANSDTLSSIITSAHNHLSFSKSLRESELKSVIESVEGAIDLNLVKLNSMIETEEDENCKIAIRYVLSELIAHRKEYQSAGNVIPIKAINEILAQPHSTTINGKITKEDQLETYHEIRKHFALCTKI